MFEPVATRCWNFKSFRSLWRKRPIAARPLACHFCAIGNKYRSICRWSIPPCLAQPNTTQTSNVARVRAAYCNHVTPQHNCSLGNVSQSFVLCRLTSHGFPVGYRMDDGIRYIFKHLRFVVKYHEAENFTGSRIVGFEVVAQSKER